MPPGVRKVYVDLDNELVLVETSLPSSHVKQQLETTGKLVVFRGFGGTGQQGGQNEITVVAMAKASAQFAISFAFHSLEPIGRFSYTPSHLPPSRLPPSQLPPSHLPPSHSLFHLPPWCSSGNNEGQRRGEGSGKTCTNLP